jgi:hypothetical protein
MNEEEQISNEEISNSLNVEIPIEVRKKSLLNAPLPIIENPYSVQSQLPKPLLKPRFMAKQYQNTSSKSLSKIKVHNDYLNLYETNECNYQAKDFAITTQSFLKPKVSNKLTEVKPLQSNVDIFNLQLISKNNPLSPVADKSTFTSRVSMYGNKLNSTMKPSTKFKFGKIKGKKSLVNNNTFV